MRSSSAQVAPGRSLFEQYPDLAAQWHPTKNGSLTPKDVGPWWQIPCWWKCAKGADHEWQAGIAGRLRSGCPFCKGKRASKERCLLREHPELAAEWHPEKNGELGPADVMSGSGRKVWWKCKNADDHEWQAAPSTRMRHPKCPYCAGRSIAPSGSLKALCPELVRQWHPTKNGTLSPEVVGPSSGQAIWWKCDRGPDHEWQLPPASRTRRGGVTSCPFCLGLRLSVTNSLARVRPELAREWHPTKNGELRPENVSIRASRKVWWKCAKGTGHEWEKMINLRADGAGCPFCLHQRLAYDQSLAAQRPELARLWHPTKNGKLTPADVLPGSEHRVTWKCPEAPDHEWQCPVFEQSQRGYCPFCRKLQTRLEHSLARRHPELARQWHPTKNGALSPEDVSSRSNQTVWWKCPEGPDHEWQSQVESRIVHPGCPCCSRRRATKRHSFATEYPDLARQWHPTKNGELTPHNVLPKSNRRVWWKCRKADDHEWRAQVNDRIGKGCPFCSGHRFAPSMSLEKQYPKLAAQWHPTRNRKLKPSDVRATFMEPVWWKCPKGPDHEWRRPPAKRLEYGGASFCPFCSCRRASVTNSLKRLSPKLSREWHPTKNGTLRPADVAAITNRLVWWKCPKGPDHEFRATVSRRYREGSRCPYCANRRVSVSNSLARVFPKVARQWHPKKNGRLTAKAVCFVSVKRVYWKCPKGSDHEWATTVTSRTQKGTGCPFCAGKRPCKKNNLAVKYPRIAKTWHPKKNGRLQSNQVLPHSSKLAWWKCENGPDHQWQARVASRVQSRCPFCAGRRVSVTNSLAGLFKTVAREWHPQRNGSVRPRDVLAASTELAWWRCVLGHSYRAPVRERTLRKRGCPVCAQS